MTTDAAHPAADTSVAAPRCVAVAYSGGRDSTALLHATLQAVDGLGVSVAALHVHHGLSADADRWERHTADRCAGWAAAGRPVRWFGERLAPPPRRPHGTEAWARERRYAALARMAQAAGASLVLLAHHRRDQAETVVLQALRGGGVAGWSAMPASAERLGLTWARPWLDRPSEAIDAYVRAHGLDWVDDDSNTDPRHDRNRLRLQAWPALSTAFPGAEQALAGAAARAQEAASCLAELAALDLGPAIDGGPLELSTWLALSPARRSNSLRAWLRAATGRPPPARLVGRLLEELPSAVGRGHGGAWWALPDGRRVRHGRGLLQVLSAAVPAASAAAVASPEQPIDLGRAGVCRLGGWLGHVRITEVATGGIALDHLRRAEPRARQGGERFQPAPMRPPRSLKLQYQAAGVPPWLRQGPLLYSGDRLLYVPGLGVDARAVAPPGVPQAALQWEPDRPEDSVAQR